MKSYREKFQTKLDEEISAFREGVLALSGQEIYDNAYKICFYEFMYNYLYSEKFTTAEYQAFLAAENTFIRQLWLQSLRCEEFNVGNIADESSLVDSYICNHAEYPVSKRMQFMTDEELVNSVWDNINDELNNFREKVKGWSLQEKKDNEEKIRFYEGMTKYLADANIFTDEYKSLYLHGKFILNDLCRIGLKAKCLSFCRARTQTSLRICFLKKTTNKTRKKNGILHGVSNIIRSVKAITVG